MIVVSDTSAITALLQIQKLDLLARLYKDVFIPKAVRNELISIHFPLPNFLRITPIKNFTARARFLTELDEGEAEAIVLAMELKADELLIDETKGRRVAHREGVHVIGLLGVVLEAKGRGLIPSAREVILELETIAGFYVSEAVKQAILGAAAEL